MTHTSTYMHKMAAAKGPMTSDQFAPRTRTEVICDFKKLVGRGLVTRVGKGRGVAFSVSPEQLAAFLRKRSSIRTELLEAAAMPDGVASNELPGRVTKAVGTTASLLFNRGLLHVLKCSKGNRWFTAAEARNAYSAQVVKAAPKPSADSKAASAAWNEVGKTAKRKKAAHRQGWGKDDPPYLPHDDAGRPLYKVTVCPGFSGDPRRTNTFTGAY